MSENQGIEVQLVVEVADRECADQIAQLVHRYHGVRVLSSRVSFPLWPKDKSVLAAIDEEQQKLNGEPEVPGKRKRRTKAEMAMEEAQKEIVAPPTPPSAPNLMQAPAFPPAAPTIPANPFMTAPVAAPVVATITPEAFRKAIMDVAAEIQTKVGSVNPAAVSGVLAEINQHITAAFPQYQNVLKIEKQEDQLRVLEIIGKFMVAKGLRG